MVGRLPLRSSGWGRLLTSVWLWGALAMWPLVAEAQGCIGDCDSGGNVTVDEIVTGVNIALGARELGECTRFDGDGSNSVTVDELIQALNFALAGCPAEPTATQPPLGTATPTATATAVATPTQIPPGPVITFFGLASASGREMAASGATAEGNPIYRPISGVGSGFLIVVEGKPGPNGVDLGMSSSDSDPFIPTFPALQIQSDRNLGNGSTTICDVRGPPPSEEPGGGVPAVFPTRFELTQPIADALNDFGCRFTFRLSNAPCTFSMAGNPRFLRDDTTGQFCTEQVVGAYWGFPAGDTTLTVRWADLSGTVGAERKLVVRVGG